MLSIIRDEKKKGLITSFSLLLINIVILSQPAWVNQHLHPATETGYRNFLRFDIAGMVFILLAHLGLCLSFLWVHKFMPYVLVGLQALGFFLVFIGMCIGMKYFKEEAYDVAAAFWWTELGVILIGMVQTLTLYHQINASSDEQLATDYQRSE